MGRRSKHWGTLKEKQAEGGGPDDTEDTESYRMWTDSKQTNFFWKEKSHMLLNANIHPDRYQTFAFLRLCHGKRAGRIRDRSKALREEIE